MYLQLVSLSQLRTTKTIICVAIHNDVAHGVYFVFVQTVNHSLAAMHRSRKAQKLILKYLYVHSKTRQFRGYYRALPKGVLSSNPKCKL